MHDRGASRILLVDGGYDPEDLPADADERYRAAACLFWSTPATRRLLEDRLRSPCVTLPDLIGNEYDWGRGAYRLAERYLAGSPRYLDLPWRQYSMEPIFHEASWLYLLMRLAAHAESLRERWHLEALILEGRLGGWNRELLEAVLATSPGLSYVPREGLPEGPEKPPAPSRLAPSRLAPSRLRPALDRLREARMTGEWKVQLEELGESLDPTFGRRSRWGRRVYRRRPPRHGTVFLSSYRNNTRSLLPFLDQVPGTVHWLLVNLSARRGLEPGKEETFWLWAFGGPGDPEPPDSGGAEHQGPAFDFWRRTSAAVADWLEVEQHLLKTLTDCWERYLDEARPSLVVVANQLGLEGWLTRIARRRGVPVLQVMHGLLGGYFYTGTPIVSDAMVVYGDLWRDLWPRSERSKILAYDPGRIVATPRHPSSRSRLTFFSWPLETKPFYNAPEFHRRYLELFHRLLSRGDIALTVRFHPLENPHDFSERWRRHYGDPPAGLRLSKSEPLEEILAATDVALMFRSTVMLDCLVSGIPVILPGWIDFVWNRELEGVQGLRLATDFEDLEAAVESWLRDPPAIDRERLRSFLRPPGEGREEFEGLVAKLTAPRRIISRRPS